LAINIEYIGNKVKAFWLKTKGSETLKILTSNDADLTFTNAIKYYHSLWSIEVFFKECKQNLNINKCQSTIFDVHIAWIILNFIIYLMPSPHNRFDDYEIMAKLSEILKMDY
jgi:hypothetical protein